MHYDYASSVDVLQIASASYHENGTIGRLELHENGGHVVAEAGSEIFCLMNASGNPTVTDEENNTKPAIEVSEGATVHTNDQNKNVVSNDIAKEKNAAETKGVANGHFDDCGAGKHSFSQLVEDEQHVYDVCTCCGYTLISITGKDQDGVEFTYKQTKNTTDSNGKLEENVTSIEEWKVGDGIIETITTETGEKILDFENTKKNIIENDASIEVYDNGNINMKLLEESSESSSVIAKEDDIGHIQDNPDQPQDVPSGHEHNYVGKVVKEPTCWDPADKETNPEGKDGLGLMVYTCSCGAYYNEILPRAAHQYYDTKKYPSGNEFDHTEECLICGSLRKDKNGNVIVAKIGTHSYDTLEHALASNDVLKDGTEITIKMINNDAIKGNGGWTIPKGANVVIDLNGYTLKNLITESAYSRVFTIPENTTLTIMDSSDVYKNGTGTGLICNELWQNTKPGYWDQTSDGKQNYNFSTNVFDNKGTLNINSGRITNPIISNICYVVDYSGTTNINGGMIDAKSASVFRIFEQYSAAKFYVTGGTIKSSSSGYIFYYHKQGAGNGENAVLSITGGHFETVPGGTILYKYHDGYSDTLTNNITGGEYNVDVSAQCADGLFSRNYDGVYKIVSINDARDDEITAKIGNKKYMSLDTALNAAKNGDTIVLYKDIERTYLDYYDKNLTIDLNGHTWTSKSQVAIYLNSGSLTLTSSVKGAKINTSYTQKSTYGVYLYSDAQLIVDNVDIEVSYMCVAIASGSTALVEIKSGTLTSTYPVYAWSGTISCTGGTYYGAMYTDWLSAGYGYGDNADGSQYVAKAKYALYYYYTPSSGDPYYWTDLFVTKEDADASYASYSTLASVSELEEYEIKAIAQYDYNGSTFTEYFDSLDNANAYKNSFESSYGEGAYNIRVIEW